MTEKQDLTVLFFLGCDVAVLHDVVPANAGTHNHRRWLLRQSRRTAFLNTNAAAYGSLLSQGRRW
jgi:3-methyladenine DNA glycosylase AlkC